jgi:hypothetical protein
MVRKLKKQAEMDAQLKELENQTVKDFEIKSYENPTKSIISRGNVVRS